MKTAPGLVLCAALAAALPAVAALEEPAFETVKNHADFEVRRYAPRIVAETVVDGGLGASNDGFRVIASYIFGDNVSVAGEGSEKIAMTAPVTTQAVSERIAMTAPVTTESEGEKLRMQFVMPTRYTMATLPRPKDPRVQLRELPAERLAVLRFSGFTTEGRVKEKYDELREWMSAEGLEQAGALRLARYDPPWTLPFLRRNEVMVPVK